jgi:cyclopropane fatty-acyl-phospholipid synthase-like methyltransferase
MRGAEFSSSAKRSKSHRSSRSRGIRALTITNPAPGGAATGADEVATASSEVASGLTASNPGASGGAAVDLARDGSRGEANVSQATAVEVPAAQEHSMRQPPNPERNRPASSPLAGAAPERNRPASSPLAGAVPERNRPASSPLASTAPERRPGSSPLASALPERRPASSPLASIGPLGLSRGSARGELEASANSLVLSDHVVFNDEKLARRYASEPIPISTLYEAYFDGSLDIPGDLVEFLQSRNSFVKHTITRQHLQWAVTNFVPEMVAHSREADARSARELFDDRGDDFFRGFLGDRLAFTCAHFDSPADSLENGSDQMNARICEKIGLRASHRVLEVGCGWGAFAAHVVASRGAECMATTLSRAQEIHANRRFAELGIERQARAVLLDYRDLPQEKFDRIVSLEAVERVGVKNLKGFFEKLRDHLSDDGLFFLQWTGLRRRLQPEDLMWGLFINKHVFPGADAALPLSSMLKVAEKSGWEVQGVENVSRHYSQTLRLWRANWESNRARTVAEHGERWFRIWQFFLAWSQIVAEQGNAACFQVVMNKNLDTLDRRTLY